MSWGGSKYGSSALTSAADANGMLDLGKKWYAVPLPLRSCSLKEIASSTTTKGEMDQLFREAQDLLDAETAQSHTDKGRWYNTQFLTHGTTADKVASAAVKLSDTDFMFFLDGFNLLFDTARADTHHYEAALKALAVIWPKLLPQRPLKRFAAQYFATLPPAEDSKARAKVLVYWYIEDYLKRTYAQFLSLCEGMLKDRLVQRREAWLDMLGKLLLAVAEGRNTAMAIMIDKLGDPTSRISHKAYHHLLALLAGSSTHQSVLFVELEKIVFMKNSPLNTMKYAVNVMNQLVFNKDEAKLAAKCVHAYLELLRQLAQSGRIEQSVTTAIIVGLRRAFPYAGLDIFSLNEHMTALFILAKTGSYAQRYSTLALLHLLVIKKGAPEAFKNRWYRALYHFLLISPKQLPHSSQLAGFFSTIHKALRTDTNDERVAAFVHRLLQRALYVNEALACAMLLLVGELAHSNPKVKTLLRPRGVSGSAPVKAPPGSHATAVKAGAPLKAGTDGYDPKHRDPQFSRASRACVWTLNLLTRHSHPSVVRLAVLLLLGEEILFDAHPLDDLTLANFLTMFVDAKGTKQGGAADGSGDASGSWPAAGDGQLRNTGGVSVFQRAPHIPMIPSASDPYFINSDAAQVEVSALFVHRYAVQRERFLSGLSQVRSTWGDASGEVDVSLKISDIDKSIFGPSGSLPEAAEDDVARAKATVGSPSGPKEAEAGTGAKRTVGKSKAQALSVEEVGSDESGDESNAMMPPDDGFDVLGSDEDFNWGSDDDEVYNAVSDDDDEEDEDAFSDLLDNSGDDEEVLGSKKRSRGDLDGEDFGEIMSQAQDSERSKKQRRQELWLDRATSSSPYGARGYQGRGRGRGGGHSSGRGGTRGVGRGGGRGRHGGSR